MSADAPTATTAPDRERASFRLLARRASVVRRRSPAARPQFPGGSLMRPGRRPATPIWTRPAGIAAPVMPTRRSGQGSGSSPGGWPRSRAQLLLQAQDRAEARRRLHRWTLAVYALGVVHAIGAGPSPLRLAAADPGRNLRPDRGHGPGPLAPGDEPPGRVALAAPAPEDPAADGARVSYRTYRGAPREPRSTSALTMKLVALSAAAAIAIGALIAGRMAAGEDPALGPKAARRAPPRRAGDRAARFGASSIERRRRRLGSHASPRQATRSQPSTSSPSPVVTRTS